MKIESNGFRVTGICPQIDRIEVDGESMTRVTFRVGGVAAPQRSEYMGAGEFSAFVEAMIVVRDRLKAIEACDALREIAKSEGRILRLKDRSGDVWEWRDDHGNGGYVIPANGHDENCEPDCGKSLEWIETNYGPIVVLERR